MAATELSTAARVFSDHGQAEAAVRELRKAGFGEEQIGLVARRGHGTHAATTAAIDIGAETGDQAEREFTGALAGAAAGGLVGAAAALLIPGLGPVMAAGLLSGALLGAGAGAAVGGLIGALTELGVPEEEARHYDRELRAGRTLVIVRSGNRYEEANEILQRQGTARA